MKAQDCLLQVVFNPASIEVAASSPTFSFDADSSARAGNCCIASMLSMFAMLLIVLSLGQARLAAQEMPRNPAWSQPSPDTGQYAPQYPPQVSYDPRYQGNPQYGSGQPAYPQNQPYPQQPGYPQAPQYPQQPGYAPQGYSDPGQPYGPQTDGQDQSLPPSSSQALNTEQLEQLVAPIALYPDTLVAQVLAASTYPAQVVDADHWRQTQGNAPPEEVVAGANNQNWDPSLKALTAFPQVLSEMDQNLRWTIALGNAYYNQPQDVLDVIQIMRQRAQAAGNLQSTPQEAVNYDQGYIQVAPTNPDYVYLPAYNPWLVYGQPIQPYRGFFWGGFGSFLGSGPVRFGVGIAMAAFSHSPFGWVGWGLDWLAHALLFHHSNYYSHSTTVADWGLPHGGPRAAMRRNDYGARDSYRSQSGYRAGGNSSSYGGYRSPGQGNVRPNERYGENRGVSGYPGSARGYVSPHAAYGRQPMEAYNRSQQPIGRSQQYARPMPSYGNGFNAPQGGGRAGYGNSYAPQPQQFRGGIPSVPQRGEVGRYNSYQVGRGFEGYSGRQEKSGGFHPFGGGHEQKFSGSAKSSGHGSSERGGHSNEHSGGHGGGHHH